MPHFVTFFFCLFFIYYFFSFLIFKWSPFLFFGAFIFNMFFIVKCVNYESTYFGNLGACGAIILRMGLYPFKIGDVYDWKRCFVVIYVRGRVRHRHK